ncbi:protein MpGH19.1 [Marchantia polymorpha subsp. ruderalis]
METIQRQKIVSVLVVIAVKALISMLHVNSIGPCGRGSGPCIPAEQWSRHVRAQDFPGSSPSASPSPLTVAHLVTADLFDSLFPARNFSFYTYVSFLTAAEAFPDFGTSGGLDSRKQEIAAFVAHIQYETSGLSFIEAGDQSTDYCDVIANASFTCFPGKKYFPRGPMQITWNYNYGSASDSVGTNILAEPELVASDAVLSFKTALWLWMSNSSNKPSCHAVMTGMWTPTSTDVAASRLAGFGTTTNILKGNEECGHESPEADSRTKLYLEAATALDVVPGEHLQCSTSLPF